MIRGNFTVYFEGPFWVGVVTRRASDGRCEVGRVVFGAEPTVAELLAWVAHEYQRIPTQVVPEPASEPPLMLGNIKRAQREAARARSQAGAGTRAQLALAAARELAQGQAESARKERRKQREEKRFEARVQKRKAKHRGK